jgi:2,5-dioxopentanoate dehydrogenase
MPDLAGLTGRSIIGFRQGRIADQLFYATNPANGQRLATGFSPATAEEGDSAANLAAEAFAVYSRVSGREKGAFLRGVAAKIEVLAQELIERAQQETALPKARLEGETARTCGQLRLFAQVVEEGSWCEARIDRADPGRKPAPKPDLRSMFRPLGPVAVFGASNFPLAFSVAGGDTASALAAGNPVIVKAHPAHPGTSEIVGRALQECVRERGLPEGTFSLLFDAGTHVGASLVRHPHVKAVGFTGSRAAGRALMTLAAARPEPIPFFGEMSSTNPVFILPEALRERGQAIAAGLHASFTLGAGQFCTKPGMAFLAHSEDAVLFSNKLKELVVGSPESNLLTAGIRSSYQSSIAQRKATPAVKLMAEAPLASAISAFSASPALFETDAAAFLENAGLEEEIFGPTTLLIHYSNRNELMDITRHLEGHLTATLHGTEEDLRQFADLVAILENKVGRLIFNGFPTGVEVSHAMVHGGPYPATSDGRSTSVGSRAIFRFCRPFCYQGFPDSALPEELKDANPLGIWRMVDGQMTRAGIVAPSSAA